MLLCLFLREGLKLEVREGRWRGDNGPEEVPEQPPRGKGLGGAVKKFKVAPKKSDAEQKVGMDQMGSDDSFIFVRTRLQKI